MKKMLFILLIAGLAGNASGQNQSAFLSDPAISPDGAKIVFVYESDLWVADRSGGTAHRITAMAGEETVPRFSPDGKWLAFASTQNGNADVYLMPVEGGSLQQLTWHDANDYPDGWSWDSKTVYFTSDRYNTFSAYLVPASGGTPVRLFSDNYFDQAHNIAEIPGSNGESYYFTTSWESFMFAHRKRYRGENDPDIEFYNKATGDYKRLTEWEGKDLWPSVDRNGKLWFASDEGNNEYNLCTFDNGAKRQVTSFPTSIRRPQVSADGRFVVFARDYRIWTYDVTSGQSSPCEIKVWSNENLATEIGYNSTGKITDFDVSVDGKKIAFVSRGRLFVSDVAGKFIREMPTDLTESVQEVRWMKDNESLLYTRTVRGWANLFTISASAPSAERQLTRYERTLQELLVSPEGDKALFVSGDSHIDLIDLKSFDVKSIITDEFWFRVSQPRFSPDGRYILYTAYRNFEQDIFIYDTREGQTFTITDNGVSEEEPYWSPDGRYIYVSADRFHAGFPRGGGESKLYRIPLYRFSEALRTEEYVKLFAKKPAKDSLKIDIKIETEGINDRWEQIDVKGTEQSSPHVFNVRGKTVLLFNNAPNPRERVLTKVELSPFEPPKSSAIGDKAFSRLIMTGDKFYALMQGDVYEVKPAEGKADKITLSATFSKNLHDEFVQMFYENWATLAEHFYDRDYHGVDWKAMLVRYERYLPLVRNRDNLRTIQNDMLGELNSSHLGFSSQGEEARPFYRLQTNATGILFCEDDPFAVQGWVAHSPADLTDTPLRPGDRLVAVEGTPVDVTADREKAFTLPQLEKELTLRFDRKEKEFEMTLMPVSSGALKTLLYDSWVTENRRIVDSLSGGRVAYVYMKDMGTPSLEKFMIDMTGIALGKEALILDIRNNRGGNVHDDVIRFLSQKPYLEWQARNGKRSPQPNFAPSGGPIILMVNEQSLSDAEMTAAAFRQLKMGTIVGTETYRWIIFTSGRQLVDGSFTRLPAWGCYDLEGNDLEKTGVKPDVYVRTTFADMQKGVDPQLTKAVEEALGALR
ncbi:MAG: S41 family peptidase [Bacteroidota bacterium]|nr:S41 family peptidase [Bacteroidota bacterium]